LHPERTVVSWNGDGCFLMNGQELATAVQYGLAVIFVVVDNGMYGTIRMHQERNYPAACREPISAIPTSPRWRARTARTAETVAATAEFAPAFERAHGERQARVASSQARSAGAHAECFARRAARAGTRRNALTAVGGPHHKTDARTLPADSLHPPRAPVHRGRLFRKYLLLILAPVTVILLASGWISFDFSSTEIKSGIAALQQEKAVGAASRIEQYIRQVSQQLAYASLPQVDASDVELRRIEFLKLLRQAPEVTDIAQLDGAGRETIAVSRLGMDVIGSGKDRSQEPAFRNARRGGPWHSPVYFRKETEPYMTIAMRSGSDTGPVTIAEVNLKFIWDVVSRIKVGDKGKAYVVDGTGFLIADPDIGLVLRKTDLSQLAHVKAAGAKADADVPAMLSTDLAGTPVLTSFAPIESLGWRVFVEQPAATAYEKLNAWVRNTQLLLVAGLVLAAIGALWLARGMVRPIRTLDEGARRIGAGDLDQQIVVRTGDELEGLADQFNRMTAQLRESYAGLERKVDERTRELSNALEQQTAISEILRVTSGSPTDVRPVLQAVAERAAHLCDAPFAFVVLLEGSELKPAAVYSSHDPDSGYADPLEMKGPFPLKRTLAIGRATLDRTTIHLPDVMPLLDTEYPDIRPIQARYGFRALLVVPLMREGGVYGVILIWRREPRAFSPDQIALLQTFAQQAAIAIDNVRLFNATQEALDQQTATAEVLKVISSSPTDVQPVFDAIAERAMVLCDAKIGGVARFDGELVHLVAFHGTSREAENTMLARFPMKPGRGSIITRVVLERAPVQIPDVLLDADYALKDVTREAGYRANLGVPMLRDGHVVGVVAVCREQPGPFPDKQVKLLQTFADQAVIAIENVRLFKETNDALQQQTAISEILRVISSSPTDVQPVLEAIAERAAKLCDASVATMYLIHGDTLRLLASKGPAPDLVRNLDALPINRESLSGRAVLEQRTIQVPDLLAAAADYPLSSDIAARLGHRTVVVTPLLREGKPFGTILLRRQDVRPFTDQEVALLRTFGDQAAIALENVRLFNETKEALDQQRASGEVLAAISSSIADATPVFERILASCERLFAGQLVQINLVGDDGLVYLAAHHGPARAEIEKVFPFAPDDRSATGRAMQLRSVVHYADVDGDPTVPELALRGWKMQGIKAAMAAPMLWEGKGMGAILVGRDHAGAFSDKDIALLRTFADQAVIAIQNARLFREIEDKSRQLETANRHKSEFLANMSHELRTPLNAIIGFSEVLLERLFGEINEKQDDYLKDIHSSGKHLLQLINDILDLSKVEAGRMELEPSTFDLPNAIANAMTLIRERAQKHEIALSQDVGVGLGEIVADERKFKQILLNLLSNAVKFTPDGGRIDVKASRDGDNVVVAVHDTGIGIAPEDQEAVFEEFRQVGRNYTNKQEGTGLGLALTRKFVELHGGRIWLESEPGKGSVFTFTIPAKR
jgi:signal transduction histidine kinase/putative methionine-R-sulfoxide reductase with GAF domain